MNCQRENIAYLSFQLASLVLLSGGHHGNLSDDCVDSNSDDQGDSDSIHAEGAVEGDITSLKYRNGRGGGLSRVVQGLSFSGDRSGFDF